MLNEVQIVIEILEVTLTALSIVLYRRQIEQSIMATRQIPIFARSQMIQNRARFIGEHNAHFADAGVDHARECEVDQAVAAGKWNGFNRTAIRQFTNQASILMQVDEPHYGIHCTFTPFSSRKSADTLFRRSM